MPKKIKNYIYYFPFKIYEGLNKKYNKKTLPVDIIKKTTTEIIGDQINKISIIITTRNRLNALKKYALASLEHLQFDTLPYEIIIIDNNSNDGTYIYLQQYAQNNKLLKVFQEKIISISAGRNKGIKMATGELLIFIDDDCEVDPEWLSRLYHKYANGSFFLGQGQIYDTVLKQNLVTNQPIAGTIAAGNLSIKKKIFDYVHFNQQIIFSHDDTDLIRQIETLWPHFPYFIDQVSIKHHRVPDTHREFNGSYNQKSIKSSVKMYNLSYLSECTLKRNLGVDLPFYDMVFILKELFFLPLELIFFLKGDISLLVGTKIKLYRQLKYLQNIL
ncbi:MAG: glycosyltransferase family A protein [Patescibacteria group bacterium]|nr:glycosyltransferase family A protein [Patescibacteria group bacterium]